MYFKRSLHNVLLRILWGKDLRSDNSKFDRWRSHIVKRIISANNTLLKLKSSLPDYLMNEHWVGKPMRSEYHYLIHFYRLAMTYVITKRFINQSSRLLDVGCASGAFILFWPNKEKIGLEQLKESVQIGKELGIKIIHGNAQDLPFEDNSFEAVFLLEIFEHVPNPFMVIEEAKRVSSNLIVCTFPVFKSTKIIPYNSLQYFSGDSHHLELTSSDFTNLITHYQLEVYDYYLIDVNDKLSSKQKYISFLSGFHWPRWHLFIIKNC